MTVLKWVLVIGAFNIYAMEPYQKYFGKRVHHSFSSNIKEEQPHKKICYVPRLNLKGANIWIDSRSKKWSEKFGKGNTVRPRQKGNDLKARMYLLWHEQDQHFFLARFEDLRNPTENSKRTCYFDLHTKYIYNGDGIYLYCDEQKINSLTDKFGIQILGHNKYHISNPKEKYRIVPEDCYIMEDE